MTPKFFHPMKNSDTEHSPHTIVPLKLLGRVLALPQTVNRYSGATTYFLKIEDAASKALTLSSSSLQSRGER